MKITQNTITITNSHPPLFLESISAGFPNPAQDCIEEHLNLNKLIIKNPQATFFLRVNGDSMIGAGIYSGDILVVDRSIIPISGNIVIAAVFGELMVKRLVTHINGQVWLKPENSRYKPTLIQEFHEFKTWGIVTYVIHQV